jgi:DHA1 family inner membrane transport protein
MHKLPWVGAPLALVAFGMGFLARAQDRKYAHRTASARKAAMFAH